MPGAAAAMTDDVTPLRSPRLTRLEIQGFKSFLHRTVIAFEPGITAVVGPNGSGKSNVADAIRWVLGEQGQQALRARKTEEVIFSGGQGRAPAGMAEATLTFDNSDGWLPSEFSEVSVTRRAYRSGENHYLINGRRVRLRDVALLTASLGQSHVVVGQGLVDAALSLKADERRSLFEHAADLTGLRLKLAEAERNLAETEANTARLNDLLFEIEPRLKSLERAARQAREWQGLRDRLLILQRAHYREVFAVAACRVAETEESVRASLTAVTSARVEVARLADGGDRASTRMTEAREQLTRHDERRGALEDQVRRHTHERDLAQARLESLDRRRADMLDARMGLDERVASVTTDLEKLHSDLRELERVTADTREGAARHRRAAAASRAARSAIEQQLAAAADAIAASERRETDLQRERAVLGERIEAHERESASLRMAISDRNERIEALRAERGQVDEHSRADERKLIEATAHRERVSTDLAECQRALVAARDHRDRLDRQLAEDRTRLDVLRRLHESGTGLHAGVREVLSAGRSGRLQGIRGTVAELLDVPQRYEVAIEVALGGRLQDLVVETWPDAEAAIAMLKHTGAGRATFHPLDTIRSGRGRLDIAIARVTGVHGIASELLTVAPDITPVIAALLGRTVVVDDLDIARIVLPKLASGWSAVTLGGEIARAGGSVTGGAPTRESGTLGRERELRELPDQVAELDRKFGVAQSQAAAGEDNLQAFQVSLQDIDERLAAFRTAAVEREREAERLDRWLSELAMEGEQTERRRAALQQQSAAATQRLAEIDVDITACRDQRSDAAKRRQAAETNLAESIGSTAAAERAEAEEGRRLAGLEERLRLERRREAGLRAQERALAEELELRTERMATLDREREALRAEHARLVDETSVSAAALAELVAEREPLRLEVMGAEIAASRLAESLQAARTALVEREREHDQTNFAYERAAQELTSIRDRIADDLDCARAEDLLVAGEESVIGSQEERAAEIGRLRERLRRVGYVGDDAVAEYEREAAYQTDLRNQLRDVEGAATALRALLTDLRQTMRARFASSFAQVAAEFSEIFAILFGGGTAQLVLVGGDNGEEPGIDIIAQPPGKRLQNLSLLSGGERALTAVALLLAILHVNPVPFCLLDEVDAALDEANVVRFRQRLQLLATHTQVIVVTHNRGTIEIADTLYGISMSADGVSQVLSLRMSESLPAD